jgi:hypothetical protein
MVGAKLLYVAAISVSHGGVKNHMALLKFMLRSTSNASCYIKDSSTHDKLVFDRMSLA